MNLSDLSLKFNSIKYDVHPKMRFSLSPPPQKYTFIQDITESSNTQDLTILEKRGLLNNEINCRNSNNMNNVNHEDNDEEISDYIQWLHAMKLVARLPGGIPSEFRRKLWLSLADKYLKSKNINWSIEEEKCFCDKWREDDEELGVQIVKDLHRTGSTLCTGPTGDINQAKLKRILLGYARYNPEVGYCQGFNMLGALILQVMDKQESESIKVMIYLVEGILPTGYFCGSMGGLQADMAVFRELMQTKLPRLAKHLQKLQGPNENAYEPPLTNVFTMQWFLTMFCTCLPMNCVLRVWDLVLIEGSDILLRTALVLWSLLEERVLLCYSADDFYGKMGSFSSELLNGHLIDPNGLIEKIVQLGPISDIQTLREKHLYNITPIKHKSGIQLYYDGDEPDIDEDSQLAVATVWGLPWGRRNSTTPATNSNTNTNKQLAENKDRLALDISLLKKQYDRLRERQKQAHIILTTACSNAYQNTTPSLPNTPIPVNQLLLGCSAIVTNKGRRVGPAPGTIPPARKPSLPAVLPIRHTSLALSKNRLTRGETIHDYGASNNKIHKQRSRASLTWKEIKAERAALLSSDSVDNFQSKKIRTCGSGKSDSSSYSEESEEDERGSTTDTSLCDEDESEDSKEAATNNKNNVHQTKVPSRTKLKSLAAITQKTILNKNDNNAQGNKRPKSWASSDIPFVLMTADSPIHSADENIDDNHENIIKLEKDSRNVDLKTENFHVNIYDIDDTTTISQKSSYGYSKMDQLSPVYDENIINQMIRPPVLGHSTDSENNETKSFDVSNEGVINEYFERVNIVEHPVKLELSHSHKYDRNTHDTYIDKQNENYKSPTVFVEKKLDTVEDFRDIKNSSYNGNIQEANIFSLHKDYSKESCKEYTSEMCTKLKSNIDDQYKSNYTNNTMSLASSTQDKTITKRTLKDKRRDPRRLTRSHTIYAEDQQEFQNNHKSSIVKNPIKNEKSAPKSAEFHENKYIELSYCKPSFSSNVLQEDYNKTKEECAINQMAHNLKLSVNYRSLEGHATSLSTSSNKEDINFKNVKKNNKDDKFRKNDKETVNNKNTEKKDDIKEGSLKTNGKNSANTPNNKTINTPIKHLKKIPSTAELEDRFNALERQNVILQRSYSESKKEPPDDFDETQIISKYINSKIHSHSHSQEASTEVHREENEEKDASNVCKKMPPTTEELERRFHTLEKQLSGGTNSNNKANVNSKAFNPKDSKKSDQKENSVCNSESLKEEGKYITKAETNTIQAESTFVEKFNSKNTFEEKSKLINKSTARDTEELLGQNSKNNVKVKSKSATEKRKSADGKSEEENVNHKMSYQGKLCEQSELVALKDKHEEKAPTLRRRSSEPPTTEELEKRYESFKRRMSSKINEETPTLEEQTEISTSKKNTSKEADELSASSIKNAKQCVNEVPKKASCTNSADVCTEPALAKEEPHKSTSETNIPKKGDSKVHTTFKKFTIPKAPKPPQFMKIDNANNYDLLHIQHNALIEELQSKIKIPENGENIKPSTFNQKRTTTAQRSLYNNNETSESHAIVTFCKSANFEPWPIQNQKMIRRFSDLPSRSDLENRLHFLEEQLRKKFHKHYVVSDSEASLKIKRLEEIPTPYQSERYAGHVNLEMRVQALEKQLSENNLKLLEAMGASGVTKPDISNDNLIVPRRLSTDTIDVTGKELVKYTHVGELNELETHHPINISINIKMSLQKTGEEEKLTDSNVQTLPQSQELEKRLLTLEQHIKDTEKLPENSSKTAHKAEEKAESRIQDSAGDAEILVNVKDINNIDNKSMNETEDIKDVKQSEDHNNNDEIVEEQDKPSNRCKEKFGPEENETNVEKTLKTGYETNATARNEEITLKEMLEKTEEQKAGKIDDDTKIDKKPVIEADNVEILDSNKKTLVLLLDNQPKAIKVRRLTRANTEELEGLFQALEKQLSERNLIKAPDGTLKHAKDVNQIENSNNIKNNENKSQAEAIAKLSQEITEFTKSAEEEQNTEKEVKPVEDEPFDWGSNPIKHHLKRKTVYLPSTKELEARFRSLERQIKLLEDVEKIDVEQRLKEIERKIQLQYSLSHEKDINRFLELCEDKNLPEEVTQTKSSLTSLTSPCHKSSQDKKTQTPTRTVAFEQNNMEDMIPSTDDLEYRYRALELHNSKKLKEMSINKLQNNESAKKQAIHPLEMLLDPSPDDNVIPTTGELEHRLRILEENKTPPSRSQSRSQSRSKSRSKSRSPVGKDGNQKFSSINCRSDEVHSPPTTEELEARLKALEQKHTFDFKMQKNFREFNQKLKDITLSPSTSFVEPKKDNKSQEQSPKHINKSKNQYSNDTYNKSCRTTGSRSPSPKVIRFKDDEKSYIKYTPIGKERMVSTSTNNVLQTITENSKTLHRILKKTLTDGTATTTSLESLTSIERANRLIKETSPLRRSGTHTGVPLRTADNINERLTSIQNTIKSIDTLCEKKPYCKEKCQRYIDSLFHDSVYMAYKKSSLEELTTTGERSRSISKGRQPTIRVSDLSITGSATSIPHSTTAYGIQQYRSTHDLRLRDYSPRRRYSGELVEYESRVRRNYTLPIYFKDNFNVLNNQSNSLIKSHHQVDRQLNTNNIDGYNDGKLSQIVPLTLISPYEGTEITTLRTKSNDNITTTTTEQLNRCQSRLQAMDTTIPFLPRPISPNSSLYQEMNKNRFNTPSSVYTPVKLDIRHTTVTSTFYDRLLTEKHLEKAKIKPTINKSPLISPSIPYQNN